MRIGLRRRPSASTVRHRQRALAAIGTVTRGPDVSRHRQTGTGDPRCQPDRTTASIAGRRGALAGRPTS